MALRIGIDARKLPDFGIGTYIRGLLSGLARIDHETSYLVLAGPAARAVGPELPANFQWVDEPAPVHSLREQTALSWRLVRLRLDLFHATHWALPLALPGPTVVTLHDLIQLLHPETMAGPLARRFARAMLPRAVARADRIIAVSERTRADLVEHLGCDPARIERIYNGVDDELRQELGRDEIERRLGPLGLAPGYLLFLGNPKPHKNLERLLHAYAAVAAARPDTPPLVCAGHRATPEVRLAELTRTLGIDARVRWIGHLPAAELPALYQGAALFLYPTLYEGFGLPVVEAMASGVPVVTSRTSALGEVAGDAAELVDPRSVDEIAGAIVRCLDEPARRAELVLRGRRRAGELSWEETARRTAAVYRRVLDAATARTGRAAASRRSA